MATLSFKPKSCKIFNDTSSSEEESDLQNEVGTSTHSNRVKNLSAKQSVDILPKLPLPWWFKDNAESKTSWSNPAPVANNVNIADHPDLFIVDTSVNSDKPVSIPSKAAVNKIRIADRFRESLSPGGLHLDFNSANVCKTRNTLDSLSKEKRIENIMKKSVINEEFHAQEKLLPYYQSSRMLKKRRKAEREKTKGKDWFDMPATELTEERKRDLEILSMRNSLDPKTFYRRDDRRVLPKYFQVGTVIEDATDFYSDRIPKKQRKQTIAEELLADMQFKKKQKEKYRDIVKSKKHHSHKGLRPNKKKSKKIDDRL